MGLFGIEKETEVKTITENNFWLSMPRFDQKKVEPFKLLKLTVNETPLNIRFETEENYRDYLDIISRTDLDCTSRKDLSEILGQKITEKTKSIWHPFRSHWSGDTSHWITEDLVLPSHPVYIVSKGRFDRCITHRALTRMGVPHFVVVEQHERDLYRENLGEKATVIVLPQCYLDEYDTCDELGATKSKGPGAARNFCIDHSKSNGHSWHWVMDDNLDDFHRLTDNEKRPVRTGATLKAAEDFVKRFSNVPLAGLNYYSFAKKTDAVPPYIKNTRIYSCLFISNDAGYRWRGRYNEDTDLSLRVLKDGLCTIQFNAFLCGKVTTQRMRGGNSQEFYDSEGTLPKSKMIEYLHPDCSKVVWKFNRWHHHVDYKRFKQPLILREDVFLDEKECDYGMKLVN